MSDNKEIEGTVESTVKPILIIYLPKNTDQDNMSRVHEHFKNSPIADEYWILGIRSSVRDEVEIQALYPKDFDAVGLEELKKKINDEVTVIVK